MAKVGSANALVYIVFSKKILSFWIQTLQTDIAFLIVLRFFSNNAPQRERKCFLLAFQSDLHVLIVRDFYGRDFLVVQEAKTLGIVYGQGFRTAANAFRDGASRMQGPMNQNKFDWRSSRLLKDRVNKMNALVWNRGN